MQRRTRSSRRSAPRRPSNHEGRPSTSASTSTRRHGSAARLQEASRASPPYGRVRARHAIREGLFGWQVVGCTVTMTRCTCPASRTGRPQSRAPLGDESETDLRKLDPIVVMSGARARAGVVATDMRVHLEIPADTIGGVMAARCAGSTPTSITHAGRRGVRRARDGHVGRACARSAARAVGPDAWRGRARTDLRRFRPRWWASPQAPGGRRGAARPGRTSRRSAGQPEDSVVSRRLGPCHRGAPPETPSSSTSSQARRDSCRCPGRRRRRRLGTRGSISVLAGECRSGCIGWCAPRGRAGSGRRSRAARASTTSGRAERACRRRRSGHSSSYS